MKENENKGSGAKDTIIYVTVDTAKINEGNIDQNVIFSDDRGDPPQVPGKPQDYLSTINKGMKVYWQGVPKDPSSEDSVQITAVTPKGGGDHWKLLDSVGPEKGNSAIRVGKVKNKEIKEAESYNVIFTINENSEEPFTVDPKLQMQY